MNVCYKRTPNISHMIVECEKEHLYFVQRMLKENDVPGLLTFSESVNGTGTSYWFDITSRKTLRAFFTQEGINRGTVYTFLKSLSDCIGHMEKYLLSPGHILLSVDTVFMRNVTVGWQADFACIPEGETEFTEGLLSIMDYLIQSVDHADMEAVKICYRLYEKVAAGEGNLEEYMDMTYSEEDDPYIRIESKEEPSDEPDWDMDMPESNDDLDRMDYLDEIWEVQSTDKKHKKQEKKHEKKKKSMFSAVERILPIRSQLPVKKKTSRQDDDLFEDFMIEPVSGMEPNENVTMVLAGDAASGRRLSYLGSGSHRDIMIDKNPFRIGSRESDNDAVIKEVVISRCHAKITERDGEFYLEDMESKNGTYLNGRILDFRKQARLESGDRISFANIGYRFE